ncbi:MAG: DUF11 domain-containing protein [Lysobacteraceae bacterium]|nr:MAG: DUF11 domain-containing protein [Xanthomonadaceae bacterium]
MTATKTSRDTDSRDILLPSCARVAALAAMIAAAWLSGTTSAQAQTVTAVTDQTCLGTRAGGTLNCTANDFTTQAILTAAAGTPRFCQAGQTFIFNADVALVKGGGGSNYDIGFFAGQAGNDPGTIGGTCSVATFPFTPAPFTDLEGAGDTCGDWSGKGSLTPRVQNIKVTCGAATSTDSDLSVPYVLSWYPNTALTCSGPSNVMTTIGSKCAKASATIQTTSGSLVQVGGYVDVTKQTLPDGDAQSFSYTATGPASTVVGYQNVVGGVATGAVFTNNTDTVNFSLVDGQTVRVYLTVVAANRTLTITEQPSGQVAHWESPAAISCAPVTGAPTLTTNNATRQIQASLNTSNTAAACTVTNTKRARVALVKNVAGRLNAADQFTFAVSGAGASTLTSAANAAIAASAVTVTTSGAGTGNFTSATNPTFRATPGQVLTLTDAMAAGSNSLLSWYETRLSCSNAFAGPGATTGLPANAAVTTYDLTPAPGDDITCTFTNTPKAKLTLAKVVVNDDGQTRTAADWTLSATGPSTISGASGAAAVTSAIVLAGNYTLSESGPLGYVQSSLACTGTADTDPSNGLALASGEIATCTFTNDDQPVGQTIVKSLAYHTDADGSSSVTEGDTLGFSVTVTNTGVGSLTSVQVSDALLTPSSTNCASVAPGNTCVLNGTYVVTATDAGNGQVSNTASVTSNQIPGPTSSNTVVTPVSLPPPAALAVLKSHSGNFSAGSNASYTLQVSNTGGSPVGGTTTVSDTLAAGLSYVSASGTNWSCGAAGQDVTCTSSAAVAAYGSMAPISLVVAVAPSVGGSIDNAAAVANTTLNGGAPVAGNTDTATVLHADLSTSTKTVANLGGGSTADVDAGDVLEYTITLIESAGAIAGIVHLTDTIQAGLGSLNVTMVPGGATDNSSGSAVDISGITVPANGNVQVKFRVTVGGGFSPGDAIDNIATIDNPAGPDATPAAPTLTYAQSQVVVTGNKLLYLRDDNPAPTAQVMDRDRPDPVTTSGVVALSQGGTVVWTLSPVIPPGETLELDAGTVVASIPLNTGFDTTDLQAFLYKGSTTGTLIGQSTVRAVSTSNALATETFAITLNGSYSPLVAGEILTLQVVNSTTGNNKNATLYAYNGSAARLAFSTSTVVNVDSVAAYAEPYASGNATIVYYALGGTVYVRAVVSDPFGGTDVGSASVIIRDANGTTRIGPVAMTPVATAAATRTFEYAATLPQQAALGNWTAIVTAYEGEEASVSHTALGTFEVRGTVTVDQAWGAGSIAGDALLLQVTGGSNPVEGSSVAPGPAVPGSADAPASTTLTLLQGFTSGSAGSYTIGLTCSRVADAAPVTVSGSGLSRTIQMPLDSSVTCTWTDNPSVPLTLVKLMFVVDDPVNGVTMPKAIPGATVEYRVIITNPATTAIDAGTLVVTDPLPIHTDLRATDLGGPGSGPVLFVDGSPASGLTYAYPGDIDFSQDGSDWSYVPNPDVDGFDPAIRFIRIRPQGSFNGNNAQFTLRFHVRVK